MGPVQLLWSARSASCEELFTSFLLKDRTAWVVDLLLPREIQQHQHCLPALGFAHITVGLLLDRGAWCRAPQGRVAVRMSISCR